MSSSLAAAVENVSKCYHVYTRNIDRLKQAFSFGRVERYRRFWALKDISFEVKRGDSVGIVGVNGSGKSTLLQILYGVLQPTSGKVQVNGKIGAMLELGGGFNPEETGRENVLINAAIMGIAPDQIPALYERIVSFADIGEFIDQPVKVYSTGMVVRLGFALQINAPKDILIVDEAMAVGDELFQRKCYAAMEKFMDDGGTVLFVSHAAALVKQLCSTAIFLDAGRLVQKGPCKVAVDNYQKFLYMREPQRSQFKAELMAEGVPAPMPGVSDAGSERNAPPPSTEGLAAERPALAGTIDRGVDQNPPPAEFDTELAKHKSIAYQTLGAAIGDVRIETPDGRRVNVLNPGERYVFRYRVDFERESRNVIFGMLIKSTSGVELGGGAHDAADGYLRVALRGSRYDVRFEFTACLLPGVYYFNCGVMGNNEESYAFLHRMVDVLAFRIRNVFYRRHVHGFVDFNYRANISEISEQTATAAEHSSDVSSPAPALTGQSPS